MLTNEYRWNFRRRRLDPRFATGSWPASSWTRAGIR